MSERTNIHLRTLSLDELRALVVGMGEPPYRALQIASWVYGKCVSSFGEMTNLSKELRARLAERTTITTIKTVATRISKLDGTRKFLFELADGERIESVLMRIRDRMTLCISTQVGCPLDCIFCKTGMGGFKRNLTCGEIMDQVTLLKAQCSNENERVNVVFMGMGEPLLNYDAVVKSLRLMIDQRAMKIAARRITVSTAGFPEQIRKLADEGLNTLLAVSLNAPTDELRRRLMPKASCYCVEEVMEASRYYSKKSGKRTTIEYVLIKGFNSSNRHARALAKLIRNGPFKLNIIPYNECTGLSGVDDREIDRFVRELLPDAPAVTVRRSKGIDIEAACGQLWYRNSPNKSLAKGSRRSRGVGEK